MRRSFLALAPILIVVVSGLDARAPSNAGLDRADRLDRQYQQDYARQFERIERSLRESTSPRDWALAARLYKPSGLVLQADAELKKGMMLRRAAEAAPNDRFVQWAWANATPTASGCDAQHPCPDRSAALAIIEPDNGAAWFPVLHEAWATNDARGTDVALARMAGATRFDDLFVESVAAWSDVYRRYPVNPDVDNPTTVFVMAAAVASAMALPSLAAMRLCYRDKLANAPASRRQVCGRIGRLMMQDGTTMFARQAGRSFLHNSATMTQADVKTARAMDWLSHQHARLSIESSADRLRAYGVDMQTTGSEIRAAELQLQREGITLHPPSGWKSSYEKYHESTPARPADAPTPARPNPASSP